METLFVYLSDCSIYLHNCGKAEGQHTKFRQDLPTTLSTSMKNVRSFTKHCSVKINITTHYNYDSEKEETEVSKRKHAGSETMSNNCISYGKYLIILPVHRGMKMEAKVILVTLEIF